MLDIQFIRDNQDKVKESAKNKNVDVDVELALKLDDERRQLIVEIEKLRASRNELAAKSGKGKPSDEQIAEGKELKENIAEKEKQLEKIDEQFLPLLKQIPNVASDDTPVGKTEEENQVVYEKGKKPEFDFEPKNHWEVAENRGWIDKERAAKVAGSRFAYVVGDLAKLQLALTQFTVEVLSNEEVLKSILDSSELDLSSKEFITILPPLMIKTEVFDAMDRLEPAEDRYKIEGEELWLQGSAEHVLGSMYMDEIIDEKDLPLRYLGYATSFRKEAGTYGADMEGIIRMHQFDKLEMEILSVPENGLSEHLFTIAIQEYLMDQLQLPYQKLLKCTADIGKPNERGVDLEVWLPGQNKYRETHTADYMSDYQSRRLKTRVRREDGSIDLVHTIDATAFAMGRTMVAIIENGQNKDMIVSVPKVLQKHMNGQETL